MQNDLRHSEEEKWETKACTDELLCREELEAAHSPSPGGRHRRAPVCHWEKMALLLLHCWVLDRCLSAGVPFASGTCSLPSARWTGQGCCYIFYASQARASHPDGRNTEPGKLPQSGLPTCRMWKWLGLGSAAHTSTPRSVRLRHLILLTLILQEWLGDKSGEMNGDSRSHLKSGVTNRIEIALGCLKRVKRCWVTIIWKTFCFCILHCELLFKELIDCCNDVCDTVSWSLFFWILC